MLAKMCSSLSCLARARPWGQLEPHLLLRASLWPQAGASSAAQPAGTASAVPPARSEVQSQMAIPSHDQAASSLVSGNNLEPMVQQLMDMGGGNWDKDTVQHALRAAFNNPEHSVEYLYSGIPASGEAAVAQVSNTAGAPTAGTTLSEFPNSAPLNMFLQGIPNLGACVGDGSLDFLRNNQQPMLQELSKQNSQLLSLIQEHHAEFLQLINESVEGFDGDIFDQPDQEMAHDISMMPAEQEAIERLEAMEFDRERVIEAFLACDRNEELAANYLLEDAGEED